MKEFLKIASVFMVILAVFSAVACGDNKPTRPWGVSDETITEIVKAKLGCETMKVIVDNMGTPQAACDQLGDCADYSDVKLPMDGVCGGRNIKASCVLRLYKGKTGNYRGELLKE
jgi:hypothetical protein